MHKQSHETGRAIVDEAAERLREILSRVPFLELIEIETEPVKGSDLLILVRKAKRDFHLIVEVRSHVQLRDARLSVERLRNVCNQYTGSFPIFCSQYLSPSIKDFCAEAGLSFFDFAGSYRLVFADVFIERDAPAARPLEKKRLRSFFAPMAARVLRRLFNEPHRIWKVTNLAEQAGASPATVSLLKDKLIGEEYVRNQGDGFVMHRPGRLLQAWSGQYRYKQHKLLELYGRQLQDELETHFSEYCKKHDTEYGFALFSGARRVAPFTRGVTQSQAYVTSTDVAAQIAKSLQLKFVDSGGNLLLLVPDDQDVLFGRQEVDGAFVVSDIQLYLDLASHPTRGEENAEFLLEQRLQPKW